MLQVNQSNSDVCDDDQIKSHETHWKADESMSEENGRSEFSSLKNENREPNHAHEEVSEYEESYTGLLFMLHNLDQRLAAAISVAESMFAARAAGDLYRGLAISPADVAAALSKTPGQPLLPISAQIQTLVAIPDSLSLQRLLWLQRVYGLTDLELDIIIIALAPEIDLRYERLYAYLHDDVTRRRPSVDLALNVLCASGADKLQQRKRFAPDAPLLRHRLITLYSDPHHPYSPLLARHYRLDEQIIRLLLVDDGLDSRLESFCKMLAGELGQDAPPLSEAARQRIAHASGRSSERAIRLYLHGPAECGQLEASKLLAQHLEKNVLLADLRQLTGLPAAELQSALATLAREAWFRGAVLHVRGVDQEPAIRLDALWQALKEMPVDVVIEGQGTWVPSANKPTGFAIINFTYPDTTHRNQWWGQCLANTGLNLDGENLTLLAQRYRMTYSQIQDAAAVAAASVCINEQNQTAQEMVQCIFAAARAQCGHDLALLATKVEPRATWDDLVLPDDATEQLRELCNRFIYRDKVLYEWGFAKKLSYGLGINALFSGGPGTGKTMAAEVIANALGLDLYKIDLAQVVSKYIGETEKNLDKVFTAAANANAILFFDEADALFGKRTEVKDSHDRYANLEISYLLQKMEQYEGIAILATNLSDNLDKAFTRRLAFSIHFPFPDEASRLKMWFKVWPKDIFVGELVDRELFARELKLTGGNFKNVALSAAFLSASDEQILAREHIQRAAQREFQKLGKMLTLK